MILSGSLQAAEWTIKDTTSFSLVYSDNLNLQNAGESGFVIQARPNIEIDGKGRRMQLSFAYAPALSIYPGGTSDGSDVALYHVLNSSLSSELYEHRLFLDVSAAASLDTVSLQGPITPGDGLVRNDNQVQGYTLSVSPYTRHRLGGDVLFENRYAFRGYITEGGQASDSYTHQFTTQLQDARAGTALGWRVAGSHSITDYSSRQDTNSSLTGSLDYRVNPFWILSGSAGYETADVQTSRTDTDGITWSLSADWTPNKRTQIMARFGHRYYGREWEVSVSHRKRRTRFELGYSHQLSNAAQYSGIDPLQSVLNPTITTEDFITDRLSASFVLTGKRSQINTSLYYDRRVYEVSGDTEWVLSARLGANRRLTPRFRGNVDLEWQYINPAVSPESRIIQAGGGLRHGIGRYSSLGMDMHYRTQTGDPNSAYTEKRVGLNFQTRFL